MAVVHDLGNAANTRQAAPRRITAAPTLALRSNHCRVKYMRKAGGMSAAAARAKLMKMSPDSFVAFRARV